MMLIIFSRNAFFICSFLLFIFFISSPSHLIMFLEYLNTLVFSLLHTCTFVFCIYIRLDCLKYVINLWILRGYRTRIFHRWLFVVILYINIFILWKSWIYGFSTFSPSCTYANQNYQYETKIRFCNLYRC